MPELPDVEILKRYFDNAALNKKISRVRINSQKILKGVSPRALQQSAKDQTCTASRRHGKYLFVRLRSGRSLIMHFGMTGGLDFFRDDDSGHAYDWAVFDLATGDHLAYVSKRLLGHIALTEDEQAFIEEKNLGPDALSLTAAQFRDRVRGRSGAIKSVLMNQSALAGLGNIYSDEVLYQSGVSPMREVSKLSDVELKKIHRRMVTICEKAIDKNANPDAFPKTYLIHARKAGAPCPRCDGTVKKAKIGSRSSYYCPHCQK